VASGLIQEKKTEKIQGSDDSVYHFIQNVPMPSYLVALASGDIKSAAIGPRSTVWTGPDELEGAKWELEADTETFIKAAEKIVYPYAWGTYNVLVLPASFPYGGMEVRMILPAMAPLTNLAKEPGLYICDSYHHQWRQAER